MKSSKLAEDYLEFNRNDRIGLVVFLGMILTIVFLPKYFPKAQVKSMIVADSTMMAALDTAQITNRNNGSDRDNQELSFAYAPTKATYTEGALFTFDPNTLSEDGWRRLGLNERTTKTILNYRSKGGRFYKKEDLKKIWGLPEAFYNRVENYIDIPSAQKSFEKNSFQKPEKKIALVDINTSDANAFIALPGIGEKLAERILNFREKLGGFYSIDQVGETWGLSDSTFQFIKTYLRVGDGMTKRLNINQASKDDLKVHPYIKWKIASAIVDYRIRHGLYNSLSELKNLPEIDEATFEKIRHYLTL
jgi:competence ComEA-like helix-hairpin-helix protein